jgi:hypothetical protein
MTSQVGHETLKEKYVRKCEEQEKIRQDIARVNTEIELRGKIQNKREEIEREREVLERKREALRRIRDEEDSTTE